MKYFAHLHHISQRPSSPARGTWVEMATLTPNPVNTGVVSRTGDVG